MEREICQVKRPVPPLFCPVSFKKRDSKTNDRPNGQSIKDEAEESRTNGGVEGGKIRYI